jgi:hypothetical protein
LTTTKQLIVDNQLVKSNEKQKIPPNHFIQCKLRPYINTKISATMLLTITENGDIISIGTIKNVPKTENKL